MFHYKLYFRWYNLLILATFRMEHPNTVMKNYVYIIEIGRTDNASNGKFSSWNTNKSIEIWVRD